MNALARWRAWLDARRDRWIDLLRIYIGVVLVAKGWHFAGQPQLLERWWDQGNMLFWSPTVAHYVVLAHVCGGAMLALGLLTRLAAAVQIPVLLGAALFVHLDEGLFAGAQNLEYAVLMLLVLAALTAHGAGPWSLDRVLFTRRERHAILERHP